MTEANATSDPTCDWRFRVVRLIVLVLCLAWIAKAATLTPNAKGYGTAEAFLPACSALTNSGYPCPSCGMTTSMSATMRGQVVLAWRAHPFGLVLMVIVVLVAVISAIECVLGRRLSERIYRIRWWVYLLIATGGMIGGWIYILWAGLKSGQWPIT